MTEAGEFIDSALHYESSWERAEDDRARFGDAVQFYGSSVGAVRGTVRNALLRYPGMSHDEITALASELWSAAVYERRLAAVVLLQTHVHLLVVTDLTRLEGFVRASGMDALVDSLATEVIRPLFAALTGRDLTRAEAVARRWEADDEKLRRAARIVRSVRPEAG